MHYRQVLVGLGGFEPPTSPLSGVRSNQLSYRPKQKKRCLFGEVISPSLLPTGKINEAAYYTQLTQSDKTSRIHPNRPPNSLTNGDDKDSE